MSSSFRRLLAKRKPTSPDFSKYAKLSVGYKYTLKNFTSFQESPKKNMIKKNRSLLMLLVGMLFLSATSGLAADSSGNGYFSANPTADILFRDSVSFNQKLVGSDFAYGGLFGRQVAISGDTAAISAWQAISGTNTAQGLVYVFVLRKGVWIQQAKLVAAVARRIDDINGGLAIDGNTIVVGVSDEDIGEDINQGAAYVFTREGNSWTKKVKLKASGGRATDLFGSSVGISGDTIIIGAFAADPYDDGIRAAHGAAYIFKHVNDNWVEKQRLIGDSKRTGSFGMNVAIYNKTAVISAAGDYEDNASVTSAIYVFSDPGTGWKKEDKIVAKYDDAEKATGSILTNNVAIDGNTIVVGGSQEGDQMNGAAYVYVRDNGKWTRQAKLTASNGRTQDLFGWTADISGNKIIVGSAWSNEYRGSTYLFRRKITGDKTVWVEENIVTAPDGFVFDNFGGSIGISGDTILVGANNQDLEVRNSNIGAAYVYRIGTPTP